MQISLDLPRPSSLHAETKAGSYEADGVFQLATLFSQCVDYGGGSEITKEAFIETSSRQSNEFGLHAVNGCCIEKARLARLQDRSFDLG